MDDSGLANPPITLPVDSIDALKCVVGFRVDLNTVDRENEWFKPGVMNFDNHAKIPLALFSHDRDMPIGLCENRVTKAYTLDLNLYKSQNVLEGSIWFNQDSYDAMSIFDMAYKGIVRGVSPGFLEPSAEVKARAGEGGEIAQAELIEISLCLLPENPDGLVTWVQKHLKQPTEISAKLLQTLKSKLPEARVSMLLSTKQLKTKEETTPPVTEPPTNTPAPVVRTKSEKDEEAQVPPGAKALDAYHTMSLAMAEKVKGMCKSLEPGSDAYEHLTTKAEEHAADAQETNELHGKTYPGLEELKAESGDEHEIPTEEIKHLKEIEKQLKLALDENKQLSQQVKALEVNRNRKYR